MCFPSFSLTGRVFLGHLFLASKAAALVLHPLPGGQEGMSAWWFEGGKGRWRENKVKKNERESEKGKEKEKKLSRAHAAVKAERE